MIEESRKMINENRLLAIEKIGEAYNLFMKTREAARLIEKKSLIKLSNHYLEDCREFSKKNRAKYI